MPMIIGAKRKPPKRVTKAAAAGDPIEIDAPDEHTIHLIRGKDKTLKGDFKPAFGRRILVFVHEITAGRPILLVKEATALPIVNRWRVKLPKVLWAGGALLSVRLAFVDNQGILGVAHTFSTQVT